MENFIKDGNEISATDISLLFATVLSDPVLKIKVSYLSYAIIIMKVIYFLQTKVRRRQK